MIVHDVVQGTPEWLDLRLGIPTMSQADLLLTPKTRKPSRSQDKYRAKILAEWLMGQPIESRSSGWMERGTDMEPDARRYYEMERGVKVEQVGFITRDDGLVGGSPDGLVGDKGILEIKCPAPHTHIRYMLGEEPDYLGQCQGYLYLTGREWIDLMSYHPYLPEVIHRIERDEEYIEALDEQLTVFLAALAESKEKLAHYKVIRPWHPEMQAEIAAANQRIATASTYD